MCSSDLGDANRWGHGRDAALTRHRVRGVGARLETGRAEPPNPVATGPLPNPSPVATGEGLLKPQLPRSCAREHARGPGATLRLCQSQMRGEARQCLFKNVRVSGEVQADMPCARGAVTCAVAEADLGVRLQILGGMFGPRVGAHVKPPKVGPLRGGVPHRRGVVAKESRQIGRAHV